MKDNFEASRKVAAEIAHLEVLRRSIPAKISTLGESFATQLVADGAKLVGTWLEVPANEVPGVRRYFHVTRIERCPLIPWAGCRGKLLKDRVLVFADGVVYVVKGKCTSDSSLKCEERKRVVDVYELLHSRQVTPEEVENLLSRVVPKESEEVTK